MFLFDLFRAFLPRNNPAGFSADDFLELALAAVLIGLTLLWRLRLGPIAERLANHTGWCMLALATAPVALRLALLAHHPIPTPDIYDEFSHLLVADTLRHFRLANATDPFHRFFETFFVLQEPTYSSIYPVGQGAILALGRAVFGHAWAGVALSTAAFCALCYWMLRGWTTPGWALLGGALAVIEFGPLNQWMNSYWGGSLPAMAGCLVFGALPRLRGALNHRPAILLGTGFAIHLLTRPYESIFLAGSVALYLTAATNGAWKRAAVGLLVVAPALGITLLQNRQVTGSWTTLPYSLSQYQYGVPAALTVQRPPEPHRELTAQQALDYKMQRAFFAGPEALGSYARRLGYRVRFYRFFLLPPLYVALAAFTLRLREARFAWAAATFAIFALGVNFFPAWQFHYVAAETCLFVLVSVAGIQQIAKASPEAARFLVFLCLGHFAFWYAMHFFEGSEISLAMLPYESWVGINPGAERRDAVARKIMHVPGRVLVFVHYGPNHIFQEEWVWNDADIDAARVVWARDLGEEENAKLMRHYPDRKVWELEADSRPLPVLSPYRVPLPPAPAAPVPVPIPSSPKPATTETLHFEPVPQAKQ